MAVFGMTLLPGQRLRMHFSDFAVKNGVFLTVFSARIAATAAKLPSVRQRRLERQQSIQKKQ